jgi:acid phosphatase type 7
MLLLIASLLPASLLTGAGTGSGAAPADPVIDGAHPASARRDLERTPIADTTVGPDLVDTTGTSALLVADASPVRRAYLRFDLSPLTAPISSVHLRLHVAADPTGTLGSASDTAGSIANVATSSWSEATSWANAPALGTTIDSLGPAVPDTWVEFDLSRAVLGAAQVNVALTTSSSDAVRYDSREVAGFEPRLVISVGHDPVEADVTVVAAVGDLACAPTAPATATACQQRAVASAISNDPAVSQFFALGDVQYESGGTAEFVSYERSYGRLLPITRPVVGNHEYNTSGASGYFGYFGSAAHGPNGWYSFDLGSTWHVVALNSNCTVVGCGAGSPQEQWLRADLTASARPCTIVMWHHPRFSSGATHGSDPAVAALWRAADELGADIVLTGHEHDYERFAPLTDGGIVDALAPREFVVGTGGKSFYTFGTPVAGSAIRIADQFGFLRLTLRSNSYEWAFVTITGSVFDHGSATCG